MKMKLTAHFPKLTEKTYISNEKVVAPFGNFSLAVASLVFDVGVRWFPVKGRLSNQTEEA